MSTKRGMAETRAKPALAKPSDTANLEEARPAAARIGRELPAGAPAPLELAELAKVLVKHYDLHEGRYDLMVEFQIGIGPVGPDPKALKPGAVVGVGRVGLVPAQGKDGPTTVDASSVNPAKAEKKRKTEA